MNIALIGYGKMGREIEVIARERGHEVKLIVDENNKSDLNAANLKKVDVAIEFTRPESAYSNIIKCFDADIPIVVGTTGWQSKFEDVKAECLKNKRGLFYASNYSIGVNIFFQLNQGLARLMNRTQDYKLELEEIHHITKLDAPSGTAITLAEGIIGNFGNKTEWVKEKADAENQIPIRSIRRENVPGTHIVSYESDIDIIQIKHEAKGRKGFAMGAVVAAEFMNGKHGIYTMKDLLKFLD